MNRKNRRIFYTIYILTIIIVTIYISFRIVRGEFSRIAFKARQFLLGWILEEKKFELYAPHISEVRRTVPNRPCKNIGVDAPNLPQNQWYTNVENSSLPDIYGLLPGFEGSYDGSWICLPTTTVKINSYGTRDYEYSLEKPSDTFRIIVLGDSHTFGLGVELNDTYPKVVEKLLNERDDGWKYEVLNFAVPGYNMLEKVEFFKIKGVLFDPNLVLVQADILADDALNRTEHREFLGRYTEEYLIEHKLNGTALNQSLLDSIKLEAYNRYLEKLTKSEVLPRIKEPLCDLTNMTKKKDTSVAHLYFFNINLNERSLWKEIDGSCGLDMFDFRFYNEYNKESDLILHPKDSHPNLFAHRLIAEEIYEKLILNFMLPTPRNV